MKIGMLPLGLLDKIGVFWRAAPYLSVGQTPFRDHPLPNCPLTGPDVGRVTPRWPCV